MVPITPKMVRSPWLRSLHYLKPPSEESKICSRDTMVVRPWRSSLGHHLLCCRWERAFSIYSSSGTLPLTAATIRSCTRFSEESRRRLTFGMPSISASFLISSLSFSSLSRFHFFDLLCFFFEFPLPWTSHLTDEKGPESFKAKEVTITASQTKWIREKRAFVASIPFPCLPPLIRPPDPSPTPFPSVLVLRGHIPYT